MKALAFLALIPLATGPAPEEQRVLSVALCNGGEIEIPLDDDQPHRECPQQACHAASCREKHRRSS